MARRDATSVQDPGRPHGAEAFEKAQCAMLGREGGHGFDNVGAKQALQAVAHTGGMRGLLLKVVSHTSRKM